MKTLCAECGGERDGHVAFHSIECTRNGMSPIQWPRMEKIEDAPLAPPPVKSFTLIHTSGSVEDLKRIRDIIDALIEQA